MSRGGSWPTETRVCPPLPGRARNAWTSGFSWGVIVRRRGRGAYRQPRFLFLRLQARAEGVG
eukprot:10723215-Lingulodinium_polyedra.AAC.1